MSGATSALGAPVTVDTHSRDSRGDKSGTGIMDLRTPIASAVARMRPS